MLLRSIDLSHRKLLEIQIEKHLIYFSSECLAMAFKCNPFVFSDTIMLYHSFLVYFNETFFPLFRADAL